MSGFLPEVNLVRAEFGLPAIGQFNVDATQPLQRSISDEISVMLRNSNDELALTNAINASVTSLFNSASVRGLTLRDIRDAHIPAMPIMPEPVTRTDRPVWLEPNLHIVETRDTLRPVTQSWIIGNEHHEL